MLKMNHIIEVSFRYAKMFLSNLQDVWGRGENVREIEE